MAETSLTYTVILGDWSDDGHGRTDKYQVEISSDGELTEKLIKTNYQANVGKLGFGLPELWEDYEKSYLNQQQLYAIQKHLKAVYYIFDEQDTSLMSNPLGIEVIQLHDDESDELPFGSFFLTFYNDELCYEDEALAIAMFVTLAGIPGASWRLLEEPPLLFGGYDSILVGNAHVGYGCYS